MAGQHPQEGGEASPRPPRVSARERIVEAAAELFYREGIRAVGIDAVIERAGVAKASLYRAFPSKDELVAAFLERTDAAYWRWFESVLARHPDDPRLQLRALFRGLVKFTTSPRYRGCPFVNTLVEFPDPAHPGRRVAAANKRELRRRLGLLCRGLAVSRPEALADQLLLIMEGAYASGSGMGETGPAGAAAAAAEALIQAALAGGGCCVR